MSTTTSSSTEEKGSEGYVINKLTSEELDYFIERMFADTTGNGYKKDAFKATSDALDDATRNQLPDLFSAMGSKSGSEWLKWCTCVICTRKEKRISVKKKSCRNWRLSEERFEELTPYNALKLTTYHLTFKKANPTVVLPMNLGSGSAISHYCDNQCTSPDHLELVTQIDNMSRQRCTGVTLIVMSNKWIIHEEPCPHGNGTINGSCRKVRIIRINNPIIHIDEGSIPI